jgi:hypothetical protein
MVKKYLPILLSLILLQSLSFAGGRGASSGTVGVHGYVKKDGTYVAPHNRSAPDGNLNNNWSSQGNSNPYTGEDGKLTHPPAKSATGSIGILPGPSFLGSGIDAKPSNPDSLAPEVSNETMPVLKVGPSGLSGYGVESQLPKQSAVDTYANPKRLTSSQSLPDGSSKPKETQNRPLTYLEQQKAKDIDRSSFWKSKGYSFNPAYMSAYSMDQKVQDIERSKFWKEKGYAFNPEYMSAYAMDQKVKDVERSAYWKTKGYDFNASHMTAYSMDQRVVDIERAAFWKLKGYDFNPGSMTAYSMDQRVRDIDRSRFWKERGLNFDPSYMSAYSMDREAEKLIRKVGQ